MNVYCKRLWLFLLWLGLMGCVNGRNADSAVRQDVRDLIAKLNDEHNIFHHEYTPAVYKLIDMGLPVLECGVLELLLSDHPLTRVRAAKVVELISMHQLGYVGGGGGWPGRYSEDDWILLWKMNGNYRWDLDEEERAASYEKWVDWVRLNRKQVDP